MGGNSAPLRILMATPRFHPFVGGVETHVHEVAERLARRGIAVGVLTTDPRGGLPARERSGGVAIRRVRAWPAGGDLYIAPDIVPEVGRGGWDLVHVQGYHTFVPPLAMLAALRAGLPYVVTFHSGGHSSAVRNRVRGLQKTALRPLLSRAERLIAVSEFEAQTFRRALRLPRRRFAVVPNGASLPALDEARGAGGEERGSLILSVGRLERYKGHHRIIRALPGIIAARPDVRLRIAGSGPYEAALRRLARDLRVEDRVEIASIPPTDRGAMASLISGAALVTLLSEYEAHPIAVMEALALERPVLVTHTSGLGELADRGLVRAVPLGGSDGEVAAAVLGQLRDPLVPTAGELPTWDGCAEALLALYRDVLGCAP